MAGDANKVWMVPTDYGKALEGFARMLGAPGEDGVFRYEPPVYVPEKRPEDDEESIKGWFDTSTDPKVAQAVREAEAVARQEVPSPISTGRPSTPAIGTPRSGIPAGYEEQQPARQEPDYPGDTPRG